MTDAERLAWAYLSRVVEPPCPMLTRLVDAVGPVEAASMVRSGGVGDELRERTLARRDLDRAAQDLDMLDRRGGRLVTPVDDEWPTLAFRAFESEKVQKRPGGWAPLVLWVVGPQRLDEVALRAAAIVGTRAATSYGEHVAAELASGLVERDVAVVSGGAFGIDGAAHRAALAAEGCTVAVLAGGVDVFYPAGHSALLHRIASAGLIVSEYAPGIRPARHRFLTRNRLVAALSGATVVVEAGLRSGAANTAAWADALGRVRCAVPGPVTSAASAGCHVLLRSGAHLVSRSDEIVEIVGRVGELAEDPAHPQTPLDQLTAAERVVFEAMPGRGVATVEQIAVNAAMPPQRVLGPLAILELAGLISQEGGAWRLVRRPPVK
ncbi:DNA-processing protein DprA [Mycobacterium sp. ACS4331]|uniref:DNA-processing protein DprA n=1 Tax=Mycobacterium sp. ACS4331 TaxID=1834121 RepID=UPI0007FE0FC1|nr:DNA-processing protein DprA [Mycobacterium sp. ACS4331]OBF17815.1 DNA protecting protein DprA [Mycobacterium sp. ACS4331]